MFEILKTLFYVGNKRMNFFQKKRDKNNIDFEKIKPTKFVHMCRNNNKLDMNFCLL